MKRGYFVSVFSTKVLAVLFACVCMWGCGWDEKVENLSTSGFIGFSKDSLVVCWNEKKEETCLHKPLGTECSSENYGTAIVVDNFETHERVWQSDYGSKYDVYDVIDDSTIVAYRRDDASFYKWTIGGNFEKIGSFSWSGCKKKDQVKGIRNWGKGKWRLMLSSNSCAYAIVDVAKKTITGYEKIDEFAEDCSDVWLHDDKKYCAGVLFKDTVFSIDERFQDGIFLKKEQESIDSLWSYEIMSGMHSLGPIVRFMNSYIMLDLASLGIHLIKVEYETGKLIYWKKYL